MKVLLDTCVWGGAAKYLEESAKRQGAVCAHIIEQYGEELGSGAIITVEPGRVRVRPPDQEVSE